MHTINTKYTFKQNINYTSICHVIFLPSFLFVLQKFTIQNCYYLHVIILHLSAVFIEIKFYYILLYTVIIHSILFHLLYSILYYPKNYCYYRFTYNTGHAVQYMQK